MSNGIPVAVAARSVIESDPAPQFARSRRPAPRPQAMLHCPDCGVANRIVRRRTAVAWCTVCGADLFRGRVLDLTLENLDAFLHASRVPALVMFWVPWCVPCERLGSVLEKVAAGLDTRMRFARVNVDDDGNLAARYRVRGIPTLLLFRNGREIARRIGGNLDQYALTRWLQS